MSMGPLGIIGSAAGVPLTQASGEKDRRAGEAQNQSAVSQTQAGNQAGVGEAEEQGESADRDADGRRLWEGDAGPEDEENAAEDKSAVCEENEPGNKDPTGNCGNQLDISG